MNQRRFVVGLTAGFGLFMGVAGCGTRIPGLTQEKWARGKAKYA